MGIDKQAPLVVQKYGGATLATPSHIRAVARRIADRAQIGPVIVVVSAMGSTTNSLIELARQVAPQPPRRELDMLLSVGERTSMALITMALHDLGVPAISFTGSQAGIMTDEDHFNARIVDVRADRVRDALRQGKVIVLAGFQGVSPLTKEITTLGRGGSDVTAVAMAAAFSADRCEILKEVPAVYTADPRLVPDARPLARLSYDVLLDMCFWGAKVLHHRSVSLARSHRVPLFVGPAGTTEAEGTLIDEGGLVYESVRPIALNSHARVLVLVISSDNVASAWKHFESARAAKEIPSVRVLLARCENSRTTLFVTAPEETLRLIEEAAGPSAWEIQQSQMASVSVTCSGTPAANIPAQILETLDQRGVPVHELRSEPMTFTVFLDQSRVTEALQALHRLLPS